MQCERQTGKLPHCLARRAPARIITGLKQALKAAEVAKTGLSVRRYAFCADDGRNSFQSRPKHLITIEMTPTENAQTVFNNHGSEEGLLMAEAVGMDEANSETDTESGKFNRASLVAFLTLLQEKKKEHIKPVTFEGLDYSREDIEEMREWAKDCQWPDVEDNSEIDEMSDYTILRGVQNHYGGGLAAFMDDSVRHQIG